MVYGTALTVQMKEIVLMVSPHFYGYDGIIKTDVKSLFVLLQIVNDPDYISSVCTDPPILALKLRKNRGNVDEEDSDKLRGLYSFL